MSSPSSKGRWVALVTGIFSILIGLTYLILITLLDSRGPMQPPPPEAFGVVEVQIDFLFAEAQLLALEQL